MNKLSIEKINLSAPYKVWETKKENEYNFLSENGVLYGVGFSEEMEIGGITSYQFSFARLNDVHGGFDDNIRKTLMAIISEFFNANDDIMIYICDTADGRETFRSRLFLKWFEAAEAQERFVIRTAQAEIDGQGFYTAMIVERSNPHLEQIIEDFEYTAKMLTEK